MKTVQINKVKVRIFEEDELREKLGMCKKDIGLILDYQRIFPELLQEDIEGFIIDARKLHNQLKLQQDFSHWIKNQIKNLDLEEEKSYTSLKTNCTTMRPNASIEYYLTLDCAKDICMTIGSSNRTNKETKEISKIVRDYFKLMEKTLRNYEKWVEVRIPERANANIMRSKIKEWCIKNGYDINEGSYAREFNMINQAVVGTTALGIKLKLGYSDKQTREHLETRKNYIIDKMQEINITLLELNMSFEDRKKFIEDKCNTEYSDLKFVV
jgi:phage anti-repressor protein